MTTPVLLLPGLHGTDDLFRWFRDAAPSRFALRTVQFPPDSSQTLDELVDLVCASLSGPKALLVAESFSGLLGARLAIRVPDRLAGVVFVNTFVTSPVPRLLGALPLESLLRIPAPSPLLRFVIAAGVSREVMDEIIRVRRAMIPRVFAHRIRIVLSADETTSLARSRVPMLYLRGTRDRLVREDSLEEMKSLRPDLDIARIDAPHTLLQCAPREAWRAIEELW